MTTTDVDPGWIEVSELVFDRRNPRLFEYGLDANSSDDKVIEILWDEMDVQELVLSIEASGFFPHEPIVVAKEDGQNVVIEGNRRLAAVKLLLQPELAQSLNLNVPTISTEDKEKLRRLPAIVDTRKTAWVYLGFKHVNGPAKWSSFAKSQFIADVHRVYGVPLEDIAQQIGDTHRTVQRLFRGLMVIEQAERLRIFDREDRFNKRFAFSHLYTGIGYEGIASFIGLRPETEENEEPVPSEKTDELGELCLWLYGSKRENKRPVIRSQNPDLRDLDTVVANGEGVAALRAGRELALAVEISKPPSTVFAASLHAAKRELEKARSLLTTGYDGSDQLLRVADDVAELANDLYEEMYQKNSPRRDRRANRRG